MARNPSYDFKNLSKAHQDCLSLIETLGIYELRALARVFGDNSPTVSKRDDHIRIVMDKIISGEEVKSIPMRPGRPYKQLSNIEGILAELSQITGKDYTLKTNQTRNVNRSQKIVVFRQVEEDILSQQLFPIEVRGVLLEKSEKEFVLSDIETNTIVLVKKDGNEMLKPFDFITGTAVVMNTQNEYMMNDIKSINFQSAKTYHDFVAPYKLAVPTETLDLDGKKILLGSRYLLKDVKFADNKTEIQAILKKLNENKIVSLAIVPNVMYEDVMPIKQLGFNNVFMIKYDESPFVASEIFNNFINHIIRLQEQGLSIAIFVQDLTTLADFVDYAYKNNTKALMGHTEMAVEAIKKVVLLARDGGDGKHTTLFATLDDSDLTDPLFVTSVYKVSKRL